MFNQNSWFRIYRPEGEVKASVFVVHGMQEHKERYVKFAEVLNSYQIACMIYDLPGHGTNLEDDLLGWFGPKDGWKGLIDSAVKAAQMMKKECPQVPLYYFGHSMGTMIGRCFLQTYDGIVDGCILSGTPAYMAAGSAGIVVADVLKKVKGAKGHSGLLDQLATGSFNKVIENPRTELDWLSASEENVDRYIADPLCGVPFTIAGYRDLFMLMKTMGQVSKYRCLKPQLPIYLFAGEQDPCIGGEKGFKDTEDRLRKAGYTNITVKLYPDMRHETMNEVDGMAVMKDTAEWIVANS